MINNSSPEETAGRVILRGIHLDLTPALRDAALAKAERLMRHEEHIIRVRIDLEADKTRSAPDHYIAKGRLEISGPDLIAKVSSEDAYKSLDLLVDKLDELIRRRSQKRVNTRNDERRQAPKEFTG